MVKLYYWNTQPNAGDYFSYWLAKKLYTNVERAEEGINLVMTGSILGLNFLSNKTTVWGAGWHNSIYECRTCKITNKSNFKAVRGKLTAEKLGLDCSKVVLGDPGILASRYYTPVSAEHKNNILILCHWKDFEIVNKYYGEKFDVVSMQTNNIEFILSKIYNAKLVLSTSLHGIIFAHSYGIPAVHIIANELESRDNFKFKDYYSTTGLDYINYKLNYKTDIEKFSELLNTRTDYLISSDTVNKIQDDLLAVLPKETSLYSESICLGAIAKNENNYIREWIEHYRSIGIDKIFLYDNNDLDGEHFEDVINDYITGGFVEVINVRGKSNQQIKCYNELYHTKAKKYKWVAFVDIDEFLYLDNNVSIKKLLSSNKYNDFDCIAVNWKYFDDNNLVTVEGNNYSIKRFTHEHTEKDWEWAQHRFSKRIVRTKLANLVVNSSHGPIEKAQMSEYRSEMHNTLRVCNIAGKKLTYNNLAFKEWSYNGGYLAHYRFKTISEYINCKMKRGYPTLYKNSGKDMNLDDFFALNKMTPAKQAYINALYNNRPADNKQISVTNKTTIKNNTNKNKDKQKADGKSNAYLYF